MGDVVLSEEPSDDLQALFVHRTLVRRLDPESVQLESAAAAGDALAIEPGQRKSFASATDSPLELMVIGVARDLPAKESFIAAEAAR